MRRSTEVFIYRGFGGAPIYRGLMGHLLGIMGRVLRAVWGISRAAETDLQQNIKFVAAPDIMKSRPHGTTWLKNGHGNNYNTGVINYGCNYFGKIIK